ncbi:MAG: PD-(D/E)XK nuclease family protein, partial [Deltaproteobacteria bacterium]
MNDEKKKKYISASQLSTFERCGLQFFFRYVENIIIPPGVAMVKGVGVHGGAKANFKQKKESHKDLPKKDIVEISVTEFERYAAMGVFLTPEEESVGYGKVLGQTKDSVVTLAGIFADEVAPAYQPKYVEEKHRIIVPNSEYDLLAIMDLATEDELVVDLKTGSKKKAEAEVQTSPQLTFYSLVFKAITGHLPRAVRLEVLVDKKNPERQLLEGSRELGHLQVLIARINRMV